MILGEVCRLSMLLCSPYTTRLITGLNCPKCTLTCTHRAHVTTTTTTTTQLYPRYKNLWTPTFLHIWHLKRAICRCVVSWIDAKTYNEVHASRRLTSLYDGVEIFSFFACAIITWMAILEQTAMDFTSGSDNAYNVSTFGTTQGNTSHTTLTWSDREDHRFGMLHTLYFTLTTFSTVGYGDITPQNESARIVVIIMLLWVLLSIGRIFSLAEDAFERWNKMGGQYIAPPNHTHHIVVSVGELNVVHVLQLIETLLAQVGIRDQDEGGVPFVVILHARKNADAESLFQSLTWKNRVQLIHGDGMNESDMSRADVANASSVFVLADRTQPHPEQADAEAVLQTWAMHMFAPDVCKYVQLMLPTSEKQFEYEFNIVCISISKVRSALMGGTCMVPGMSTLVTEMAQKLPYQDPMELLVKEFSVTEAALTKLDSTARRNRGSDVPMSSEDLKRKKKILRNRLFNITLQRIYAQCTDNTVFSTAMKHSAILEKYSDPALQYTFQAAAFDVLKYGISFIGVKIACDSCCSEGLNDDEDSERRHSSPSEIPDGETQHCDKRRGYKCGEVVVNPIRRSRVENPFCLEPDDVVYYVAKAPLEFLRPADDDSTDDGPSMQLGIRKMSSVWTHPQQYQSNFLPTRFDSSMSADGFLQRSADSSVLTDSFVGQSLDARNAEHGSAVQRQTSDVGPAVMYGCTATPPTRAHTLPLRSEENIASPSKNPAGSWAAARRKLKAVGKGSRASSRGPYRAKGSIANLQKMDDQLDAFRSTTIGLSGRRPSSIDGIGFNFNRQRSNSLTGQVARRLLKVKPRSLPVNTFYAGSPATEPVWMVDDEAADDSHAVVISLNSPACTEIFDLQDFIILDLSTSKEIDKLDSDLGILELIYHCRRVRDLDEGEGSQLASTPIVLLLPTEPASTYFKDFVATLPCIFYFVGSLDSNNTNLAYCIKNARVILVSRGQAPHLVDRSADAIKQGFKTRDAWSISLAGRLPKQHKLKKTASLIFEMTNRNNFKFMGQSAVDSKIKWKNRFEYLHTSSYRGGHVVCDTFVDVLLVQAYFFQNGEQKKRMRQTSGQRQQAAQDLISIYNQLLAISVTTKFKHGYCQSSSHLHGLNVTRKILKEIHSSCDGRHDRGSQKDNVTYNDACYYVLKKFGALPLGLYLRSRSDASKTQAGGETMIQNGTVLCNPPLNTPIYHGDWVYIIQSPDPKPDHVSMGSNWPVPTVPAEPAEPATVQERRMSMGLDINDQSSTDSSKVGYNLFSTQRRQARRSQTMYSSSSAPGQTDEALAGVELRRRFSDGEMAPFDLAPVPKHSTKRSRGLVQTSGNTHAPGLPQQGSSPPTAGLGNRSPSPALMQLSRPLPTTPTLQPAQFKPRRSTLTSPTLYVFSSFLRYLVP